jgi:hypothetical protein
VTVTTASAFTAELPAGVEVRSACGPFPHIDP